VQELEEADGVVGDRLAKEVEAGGDAVKAEFFTRSWKQSALGLTGSTRSVLPAGAPELNGLPFGLKPARTSGDHGVSERRMTPL
jgi:hypothetical protein